MSFHVGDTAPDLTGRLTTGGQPKDVTGATLEVHLLKPDGTMLTRAASIDAPTTGDWSMPWQVGDLSATGSHQVEVQVTYASGKIQTFGPQRFVVVPELA